MCSRNGPACRQPRVEKEDRDIRAVADTKVKVSVKASEPLQDATVVIDKGTSPMQSSANASDGSLTVAKPAHYYVASRVAGEMVALTDEYEISVVDDEAPTIEVVKPGRDARASSIEEVPVTIRAKDDFKVQNVELRYAVNGGAWQKVKLPVQGTEVQTKTLLQMEELGGKTPLVPGDLVTYYAATSDRNQSAQTDPTWCKCSPSSAVSRKAKAVAVVEAAAATARNSKSPSGNATCWSQLGISIVRASKNAVRRPSSKRARKCSPALKTNWQSKPRHSPIAHGRAHRSIPTLASGHSWKVSKQRSKP